MVFFFFLLLPPPPRLGRPISYDSPTPTCPMEEGVSQPATVACKNGSSVGMRTFFLHVLAPTRVLGSRLLSKIFASELRRKSVKSALLVGFCDPQNHAAAAAAAARRRKQEKLSSSPPGYNCPLSNWCFLAAFSAGRDCLLHGTSLLSTGARPDSRHGRFVACSDLINLSLQSSFDCRRCQLCSVRGTVRTRRDKEHGHCLVGYRHHTHTHTPAKQEDCNIFSLLRVETVSFI